MFDFSFLLALSTFYFVMYATPGPNNAMILSSGIQFGFLRTLPHMAGITIGHVIQLILVCLGFGSIFTIIPELQTVLKIFCSMYIGLSKLTIYVSEERCLLRTSTGVPQKNRCYAPPPCLV